MRPRLAALAAVFILNIGLGTATALCDEAREYRLSQIIEYSLDNGTLTAVIRAPAELRTNDGGRFRIAGSTARWSLRTTHRTPDGDSDQLVYELSYEDAGRRSQDGHIRAKVYVAGDDYLCISAKVRTDDQTVALTYRGRPNTRSTQLELFTQQNGQMLEPLLSVQSESLQSLANEHTDEFEQYVSPTLRKLAQSNLFGPGAADVYDAFDAIRPDRAAVEQLEKILPRFDSDDVRQRQEASRELGKLGPTGVLAALRAKGNLSPEQTARLASFVDQHRRQQIVTVAEALRSRTFLIGCLEYEDPAVRTAAKAQLEKLLGRAVSFNPQAGWEDRCRQAEQVRAGLYEGRQRP